MAWRVEAVLQVSEVGSEAAPIPVGATTDLATVVGLAEAMRLLAERDSARAERVDPTLAIVAHGHLAEMEALVAGLMELPERNDPEAARAFALVPPRR